MVKNSNAKKDITFNQTAVATYFSKFASQDDATGANLADLAVHLGCAAGHDVDKVLPARVRRKIFSLLPVVTSAFGREVAFASLGAGFSTHPNWFEFERGKPDPANVERLESVSKHIAQGEPNAALAELLLVLENWGLNQRICMAIGTALSMLSSDRAALFAFEHVLGPSPHSFHANMKASRTAMNLGEVAIATRYFAAAVQSNPDSRSVSESTMLADLARSRHHKEVKALVSLLRSLSEDHSPARSALKKIYRLSDDFEAVIQICEEIDPHAGVPQVARVVQVKHWTETGGGSYVKISDPITVPYGRRAPNGVIHNTYTDELYVAELDGCSVFGSSDLVLAQSGLALSDNLSHVNYGHFVFVKDDPMILGNRKQELLLSPIPEESRRLPEAFSLLSASSHIFGHWFADHIPKLYSLLNFGLPESVPILVDEAMPTQHFEFVAALVPNPLVRVKRGENIGVGKLYSAPMPHFFAVFLKPGHSILNESIGVMCPTIFSFLRDRIFSRNTEAINKIDVPEKVYLSRGNGRWRSLLNEEKIVDALTDRGFVTMCLADHNFIEQVAIMSKSKFLVGPVGSSFDNIIFSGPETRILILQSRDYNWDAGLAPLRTMGCNFSCVLEDSDGRDLSGKKHRAFHVNVERLLEWIDH